MRLSKGLFRPSCNHLKEVVTTWFPYYVWGGLLLVVKVVIFLLPKNCDHLSDYPMQGKIGITDYFLTTSWQLLRPGCKVVRTLSQSRRGNDCWICLKRGCMRVWPLGGTGPSPILMIFAPGVGINPKPGHEVLFWQVISKNVHKTERKVHFGPILEKHVFQFLDRLVGHKEKL